MCDVTDDASVAAAVAAGPIEETLTSSNLTRTFGLPLSVQQQDGRFSARAVRLV